MATSACLFSVCLVFLLTLPAHAHRQHLTTCLKSGGVTNITMFYSTAYLSVLNGSIQNLRFAQPLLDKPLAVISPSTKHQVAVSIRCARKGSWTVRLRSGDHSYEGLSSYADAPFVLIDLMNMNRVQVDLDSETAWAEAGATLGELYYAIANSSKAHGFSGGMCATVGSGGHISGGGYGALLRKYGLAADNVVDAMLVDAKGRILDRRAMGEKVFWAIRGGGGGNWGAVVAWKVRMLRVPETVTAFRVSIRGSAGRMAELWYKWQLVAPSLEDEFFLQTAVFAGNDQTNSITMVFVGLFLGPRSSALSSIDKAFPELGVTVQDCKQLSWAEAIIYIRNDPNVQSVSDLLNRFSYTKTFTKSKADFVKSPIPKSALIGALELVARQPKGTLLLDPYRGMNDRINSNSIPFPHRAGNLYAIEYSVDWEEEDDRENGRGYIDWIRKIYEYI